MKIAVENKVDRKDVEFVKEQVRKHNEKFAEDDNHREMVVLLRDDSGGVKGGLIGGTYWGWMYIDALWVDESLRGGGYGKQLLDAAEEEARGRECENVHLDTHDFQAKEFYEKNGYVVCGALEGLPKGHTRYLMRKKL